MADITFRRWLELASTDAGVAMDNKGAIEKMGKEIKTAMEKGQDVTKAAEKAGAEAAQTITGNAANTGKGGHDLEPVTTLNAAVQKAGAQQTGKPIAGAPMKMKKK